MTTITIEINEQGESKIAVNGVAGPSCNDVTKPFQEALGQTERDTITSDYYKKAVAKEGQRANQS
jgi:hypothetical protein